MCTLSMTARDCGPLFMQEVDENGDPTALAARVLKAEAPEREREWNTHDEQLADLAIDISDQLWEDLTEELASVLVALDSGP
mmetsp:Transcript_40958/g.73605  ORF Transcript_40958/g.73605 Transcript_40958/m.73605 type:complete len:82 (+) Transcript_40958:66-311(+)